MALTVAEPASVIDCCGCACSSGLGGWLHFGGLEEAVLPQPTPLPAEGAVEASLEALQSPLLHC